MFQYHRIRGTTDPSPAFDPNFFERGLDPARVIERAALPVVRGIELMAMADIEKATLNKRDWRRLTGIQGRDFGGSIVIARKGARG